MKKVKPLNIDYKEKKFLSDILIDPSYIYEVKKICQVLLLYNDFLDISKVEELSEVKRRMIFYYVSRYRKDKRFMITKFKNRKKTRISDIEKYELKIAEDFEVNPIFSYREATLRISEITGISRSETQIRNFLIRHDFYKNTKGRYLQKQTDRVKKKKREISPKSSYLIEHKEEIIKYIDNYIRNHSDAEMIEIITVVKEKYPLIKESILVLDTFIQKNSSYF